MACSASSGVGYRIASLLTQFLPASSPIPTWLRPLRSSSLGKSPKQRSSDVRPNTSVPPS